MMFKLFIKVFLIFTILSYISCDVVCSEDELVKELLEDLADNGIYNSLIITLLLKENLIVLENHYQPHLKKHLNKRN